MTGAGRPGARAARVVGAAAVAVLVLDVLTKVAIERAFRLGEGVWLVDGILKIEHVRNPGVAFGMFGDLAWRWRFPFFLLTLAAATWLLWSLWDQAARTPWGRIALGMIAGGAVGNLIDRVRYGEVVDFIDVWIGRFHWPTFNVADSAICVGTGLLLLVLWRAGKESPSTPS